MKKSGFVTVGELIVVFILGLLAMLVVFRFTGGKSVPTESAATQPSVAVATTQPTTASKSMDLPGERFVVVSVEREDYGERLHEIKLASLQREGLERGAVATEIVSVGDAGILSYWALEHSEIRLAVFQKILNK